ncbi:MAG: hypothetical protein AB1630_11370 [bacterium]
MDIEGTNLKARNIIRRDEVIGIKSSLLKIIQGCSSISVFKLYPYPIHYNPR